MKKAIFISEEVRTEWSVKDSKEVKHVAHVENPSFTFNENHIDCHLNVAVKTVEANKETIIENVFQNVDVVQHKSNIGMTLVIKDQVVPKSGKVADVLQGIFNDTLEDYLTKNTVFGIKKWVRNEK